MMDSDPTDPTIGDPDSLFDAVKAKLRSSIEPGPARPGDALGQVKAEVLQCVGALDELHATVARHIDRACALEADLSDAQSELVQTRVELARSRAGERAARHRAAHDDLTSLSNGAGFRARLEAVTVAATHDQSFAVLYIDLDGFKAINDTHGHATGDHLLRIIAARLSSAVRSDDMVSRLGGDEFACLLWAGSPGRQALTRLARTLFDTVSEPFQVGSLNLVVRPSIGIAVWPADGATAQALLEHADAAMYCAKRQQSGHAFFDRGMVQ